MIVLKKLTWSNVFSYGRNNEIQLDSNRLAQITGKNGDGKSAIGLILQEILYGKNAKGIKKDDLFNRYLSKEPISIKLEFSSDEDNYVIDMKRTNTVKLKLIKNNNDISSHTSTGTYKQIQEIIGYDFKTFVQVTSQSSTSGLEFLTSTDTNRKNFLINFLNLEEYTDLNTRFKGLLREATVEVNEIKGSLSTIEDWIVKHKEFNTDPIDLIPMIQSPEEEIKELSLLEQELQNASSINKSISENEQYKALLKSIPSEVLTQSMKEPEPINELISSKGELRNIIDTAFSTKKKYENLGDVCHTCNQKIDKNTVSTIVEKANNDIHEANKKLADITSQIEEIQEYTKEYTKHKELIAEFERLSTLIDNSMSNEYVDKGLTEQQIQELKEKIQYINSEINKIQKHNIEAESHNSKIAVISEQLVEYGNNLKEKEIGYVRVADRATRLEILKDAFSTKGIVAYKIESLIKDLERLINEYLSELSDGRFLINFILSGDKLNIEILTDSSAVAIESLSAGELSRVNVSTLLALRKMMSAISTNRINTLFLDEITAVLDDEGKEKLVEMLMKEEDLNTFLIAHDYQHPLIPTIQVVKTNNISEVIHG